MSKYDGDHLIGGSNNFYQFSGTLGIAKGGSVHYMMQQLIEGTTAVDAANSLASDEHVGGIDPTLMAKVPVQERGKLRFNAIVAAAEELVLEGEGNTISPYKVAKKAGIPPASVYQYFPSMSALFSVMAEKHFMAAFRITQDLLDETEIRSWRDLASVIVDSCYIFYTQDKICEFLFLGVAHSPGVDDYANARLTRLGLWYLEYFNLLYKKSDLDALPEKLALCVQVIETVFNRSLNLHGDITETYKDEARILVMNYLSEFFASIEDSRSQAASRR